MVGRVLVYRPRGQHDNSQYMSTCTRGGHVSVLCWGWISHEGAGMLHHIEGHLDSLQYLHILQNVMLSFVWMLHPNGINHFQQDQSSIHDSFVVKKWLSLQADVELIDWLTRATDMNPNENMWSEVKRTLQETWPVLQVKWAAGAHFSSGEPWKFTKRTEYDSKTTFHKQKHSIIKSVNSRDKYWYFCVNSQLHAGNILTTTTKIQVRADSIHHFDYAAKYSLK